MVTVSALLFGIYTLLMPRTTLRAVELDDQVGHPSSAQLPGLKSELKQYQEPDKPPFFKFVFWYQRYGQLCLSEVRFVMKRASTRSGSSDKFVAVSYARQNVSQGVYMSIQPGYMSLSVESNGKEENTPETVMQQKQNPLLYAVLIYVSPEGAF